MQFLSGEAYAKREVPTTTGIELPVWANRIVSYLRVEFANIQRGISRAPSRTVTADATATVNDGLILVDATAGNVSLTLPAANSARDLVVTVKRIDGSGNTVTIVGTVDGAVNPTLAQWKSKTVWAYAPAGTVGYWYSVATV